MHEYAYRCLPSLYFSTTHFPLSADSDEKFGRRLRRPISSWITPLFFHALVKRFHNTHVSFSKRSLKGRRRKTPTISFDFQLYDFVFFFLFRESIRSNCRYRCDASSCPAVTFTPVFFVWTRRDSRHWPRKLCDAGHPRFREVERACRAVTRMEEFRRAHAHFTKFTDRSFERFPSPPSIIVTKVDSSV